MEYLELRGLLLKLSELAQDYLYAMDALAGPETDETVHNEAVVKSDRIRSELQDTIDRVEAFRQSQRFYLA